MKKSIIIAALALAISAVSCQKERDCVCKDSSGTETTTTLPKAKKADQKEACDALGTLNALFGGSCELK